MLAIQLHVYLSLTHTCPLFNITVSVEQKISGSAVQILTQYLRILVKLLNILLCDLDCVAFGLPQFHRQLLVLNQKVG